MAIAIHGANIFTGTFDDGAFLSSDNGVNWDPINNGLICNSATAFAFDSTDIFLGSVCGVFKSGNNGTNWSQINNGLLVSYISSFALTGNSVFAGGNGGISLTNNNGASWVSINDGLPDAMVRSLLINNNYIFAGTDSGVYKRSLLGISTEELSFFSMLQIYPNPVTNNSIAVSAPACMNCTIEIYGQVGNRICEDLILNDGKMEINLQGISSGIYFVKVTDGDKQYSKKIIVENN
jgi:hypothetical protein